MEFIKYNTLLDIINKKIKKKCAFDQGLIQFLWSFYLIENKDMKYNFLIKYVYSRIIKRNDIIICYYKVNYKLAAKRAVTREKKCFTDYINFTELVKLYYNHQKDFKIIEEYAINRFYIIESVKDLNNVINDLEEKNG